MVNKPSALLQPPEPNAQAFEATHLGRQMGLYTLRSTHLQASWCNQGARLLQLWVPDQNSHWRDVVLGFDDVQQMLNGMPSMGAFVGRYANRIRNATFPHLGRPWHLPANDGMHCLHGGPGGSRHQVFDVRVATPQSLTMAWAFESKVDGFPGDVDLQLTLELDGPRLIMSHVAHVRGDATPLSFTAHPFFNLDGDPQKPITDHSLQILASQFVPVDAQRIPLGHLQSVQGTAFDFQQPTVIGQALSAADPQLLLGSQPGFDHAWFTGDADAELRCQAMLSAPESGIRMEVWSDAPSLQFYSGMAMDGSLPRHAGKSGQVYRSSAGLCLEPQQLPDAPNHPEWGVCMHPSGSTVRGRIEYRFDSQGIQDR
jgi:aldose 1-epimerase